MDRALGPQLTASRVHPCSGLGSPQVYDALHTEEGARGFWKDGLQLPAHPHPAHTATDLPPNTLSFTSGV